MVVANTTRPILLPTKDHPHPVSGESIPLALGHELCGRVNNPPPGSRFEEGEAVMVDPRSATNVFCDFYMGLTTNPGYCVDRAHPARLVERTAANLWAM